MRTLSLALAALSLLLAGCVGAPTGDDTVSPQSEAPAEAGAASGTPFAASGSSRFEMVGTCIPLCVYVYTEDIGSFKVDAPLEGVVVEATWTAQLPLNEELIVSVVKRGSEVASATGPSPLVLDVGALETGTYEVRLFYTTPVGRHAESIDWTVNGTYA